MAEQNQRAPKPVPVEPVPVDPEPVAVGPVPVAPHEVKSSADEADAAISLVDSEGEEGPTRVRARSGGLMVEGQVNFARALNRTGAGATRCKLFHSRIALAPLDHMERSINEWLDAADVEVKQVGHIIGTMEGKSPEPNLIMVVWY